MGAGDLTQGLDFPGVTLVGVILADFTLNLPDFRSSERTFQLLTQVSGRAGRSCLPGKVVIQTYSPEHYSILYSSNHDYKGFYENEIEVRERFGYPPFSRLMNIIVAGAKQGEVAECSRALFKGIKQRLNKYSDRALEIFGPGPAVHSRIKGKYRWQIIIKCSQMEIIREDIKNVWLDIMRSMKKDISIIIDIDPYSLM